MMPSHGAKENVYKCIAHPFRGTELVRFEFFKGYFKVRVHVAIQRCPQVSEV